jgi:hypothetical protein
MKIQPGLRAAAFSTNPQRSLQQQALDLCLYLTVFVKVLMPVIIAKPPSKTLGEIL